MCTCGAHFGRDGEKEKGAWNGWGVDGEMFLKILWGGDARGARFTVIQVVQRLDLAARFFDLGPAGEGARAPMAHLSPSKWTETR